MPRFRTLILHPFLIAAYPVLALLAHNIEEIDAIIAVRALLFSLAFAGMLFLLFRFLLKSWSKAGLVASLSLIIFFSYGHVYGAARPFNETFLPLGRHRLLVPLFLILWTVLVWLVARYKGSLSSATQTVNLVAFVVLLFPIFGFVRYAINARAAPIESDSPQVLASNKPSSGTPDIYYIILDGYSRDDVLRERWKYDNSAFLDELAKLGFYVAPCSKSNFAQTQLSLASSLNMEYLQDLSPLYNDPKKRTRATLPATMREGVSRRFLEDQGYKVVGFESGYGWTDFRDADYFLKPEGGYREHVSMLGGANQFEVMLMNTSAAILVADATIKLPEMLKPDLQSHERMLREHILYILDTLPKVPRLPGAKFVFAHIVSPHSPYIFGPNGEEVSGDVDTIDGYGDQVTYINKRIVPVLEAIIAESQTPPIIILQADHGWSREDPERRVRILNAYYLPDGGDQFLYEDISPVNTFRLIFNYYFDADFPLLDDLSYYSPMSAPYDYTLVPEGRPGCKE